jgi:uncharacterized protein HemX
VIAWYAPTWKAPAANQTNTSNPSTGTATAAGGPAGAAMRRGASAVLTLLALLVQKCSFTSTKVQILTQKAQEEEESDGLLHHARRLLAMREANKKVKKLKKILTQKAQEDEESDGLPHHARRLLAMREGTQFACFTGTKVQILTKTALLQAAPRM